MKKALEPSLKGTPYENTRRVEIFVDGKFLMGVSTEHNPKNTKNTIKMLEDFVAYLKAPRIKVPVNF